MNQLTDSELYAELDKLERELEKQNEDYDRTIRVIQFYIDDQGNDWFEMEDEHGNRWWEKEE